MRASAQVCLVTTRVCHVTAHQLTIAGTARTISAEAAFSVLTGFPTLSRARVRRGDFFHDVKPPVATICLRWRRWSGFRDRVKTGNERRPPPPAERQFRPSRSRARRMERRCVRCTTARARHKRGRNSAARVDEAVCTPPKPERGRRPRRDLLSQHSTGRAVMAEDKKVRDAEPLADPAFVGLSCSYASPTMPCFLCSAMQESIGSSASMCASRKPCKAPEHVASSLRDWNAARYAVSWPQPFRIYQAA